MKILHIITSLKIGGAESALYNLLAELKKKSNDQHYVAFFYDGPNFEKIKKLDVPLFQIKGLFFKYDFVAYLRLKKLVQKIKPDVIHSALWSANLLSRLVAKKLRIPILCDLHSNFSNDGKLRIFIEKKILRLVPDYYVAVSSSAKKGFIQSITEKIQYENKRKILENKIIVIQNGINLDFVYQKAIEQKISKTDLGFEQDDFVVGSVGRLDPIKSFDVLIKAFAAFYNKMNNRKIKLCIVGDGLQKSYLKELTKELKITDNVFFAGQQAEPYGFYLNFDCFVLSSQSEGLSIALLEALCFGLPIITTHADKKHDVIVDGQNGFLVPVSDVGRLAQAMEVLFLNPELIKRMRIANKELVKGQFGIDVVGKHYQDIYCNLAQNS